jgi:hypothetical protein
MNPARIASDACPKLSECNGSRSAMRVPLAAGAVGPPDAPAAGVGAAAFAGLKSGTAGTLTVSTMDGGSSGAAAVVVFACADVHNPHNEAQNTPAPNHTPIL